MGDYQLEQRTNLPSTTQHYLAHASHYRGVQATLNIKASHTFEEVALEIEQENILVKIFFSARHCDGSDTYRVFQKEWQK